jgi:5-methylthioadenosine/S-adenosylhomocysteine deaminase
LRPHNPDAQLVIFRCRWLLSDAQAPLASSAGLAVSEGRIFKSAPFRELRDDFPQAQVMELDGLVVPGFIDAHTHLRGIPLRAIGVEDAPLELWLLRLGTLTGLSYSDDATVASADALATGITSVQAIHHTYSPPEQYRREIQQIREGLGRTRIRSCLGLGITDQAEYIPPGREGTELPASLRDYRKPTYSMNSTQYAELVKEVLRDNPPSSHPSTSLFSLCLAPVAPQWCSDELLKTVSSLSEDGLRVHTHLLESRWQRSWIPHDDPVSRLSRFGLISKQLSVAHGVWMSHDEVQTLALCNLSVVHCPVSNRRLQTGDARVADWLSAGLIPALGTDGHGAPAAPDFFDVMREALSCAERVGSRLTARQVFDMATAGGAAAIGSAAQLGKLLEGYIADFVCVVMEQPKDQGAAIDELVRRATPAAVSSVVVDGQMVIDAGRAPWSTAVDRSRTILREELARTEPNRRKRLDAAGPAEAALDRYLRTIEEASRNDNPR